MSTASLLQGRSGTFGVCIGSLGLFARDSAHTEHFGIASFISPFILGQKTSSRAFLKHASTPRWLLWLLEMISGLSTLGMMMRWLLNSMSLCKEMSYLRVQCSPIWIGISFLFWPSYLYCGFQSLQHWFLLSCFCSCASLSLDTDSASNGLKAWISSPNTWNSSPCSSWLGRKALERWSAKSNIGWSLKGVANTDFLNIACSGLWSDSMIIFSLQLLGLLASLEGFSQTLWELVWFWREFWDNDSDRKGSRTFSICCWLHRGWFDRNRL